jgi:hypothetical protein
MARPLLIVLSLLQGVSLVHPTHRVVGVGEIVPRPEGVRVVGEGCHFTDRDAGRPSSCSVIASAALSIE